MKKTQKRTCNGCRAADLTFCQLRYKTELKFVQHGYPFKLIPLEPCEKPKTLNAYIEIISSNIEQRYADFIFGDNEGIK